jgi:hypothetical protein
MKYSLLIAGIALVLVSCRRSDPYYNCFCYTKTTGESFANKDMGKVSKDEAYTQCRALIPDTVHYDCTMMIVGR